MNCQIYHRNPFQHHWIFTFLFLLVLDCRIPHGACWIYVFDARNNVSAILQVSDFGTSTIGIYNLILQYDRTGRCCYGTQCWNRGTSLQHDLCVCVVLVCAMDSYLFALNWSCPLSNGTVQPFRALGWWQWTYRLSPYTYQIEGILGQGTWLLKRTVSSLTNTSSAVGGQLVNCSPVELVSINPPSGQTCGQYMGQYMQNFGGYVTDINATTSCQYCAIRTTDGEQWPCSVLASTNSYAPIEFLQANFNIYCEVRHFIEIYL